MGRQQSKLPLGYRQQPKPSIGGWQWQEPAQGKTGTGTTSRVPSEDKEGFTLGAGEPRRAFLLLVHFWVEDHTRVSSLTSIWEEGWGQREVTTLEWEFTGIEDALGTADTGSNEWQK